MQMNMFSKGFLAVFLLVAVFGLSACKQEGPAERAGKKVDQTVEQTGEKIDEARDAAGKKIEEAKEAISD
jgi:hyperosmotically inducible periplasmic protein